MWACHLRKIRKTFWYRTRFIKPISRTSLGHQSSFRWHRKKLRSYLVSRMLSRIGTSHLKGTFLNSPWITSTFRRTLLLKTQGSWPSETASWLTSVMIPTRDLMTQSKGIKSPAFKNTKNLMSTLMTINQSLKTSTPKEKEKKAQLLEWINQQIKSLSP